MSEQAPTKLWSKKFSLLSLNSLIFLSGNAAAGFILGLEVYDESHSSLLFAFFTIMTFLPRIILPALLGPLLDRYPKITALRVISIIYLCFFTLLAATTHLGIYNYALYIFYAASLGALESSYSVAYQSIYPDFIAKGFFAKAYAVNSTVLTVAPIIMLPVAGAIYEGIGIKGIVALFLGITALAAAACISLCSMKHTADAPSSPALSWKDSIKKYIHELALGAEYLMEEKALLRLVVYNFVIYTTLGTMDTLLLPFFASSENLKISQYSTLMAFCTAGTLLMSLFFYRFSVPKKLRFPMLTGSYILSSAIVIILVLLPFPLMLGAYTVFAMACNSTNNLRNSSVQFYIPNSVRGRFNGAFLMFTMSGKLLGQLVAGVLGEVFKTQHILAVAGTVGCAAAFILLLPRREKLRNIINSAG